MVQCNRMVFGVQYLGLSSISAVLKNGGHQFFFFDTSHYSNLGNIESAGSFRESKPRIDLEFKQIKESLPQKKDIQQLIPELEKTIENHSIDIIGISCFSDDWPFALFLIRFIKEKFPDFPIIVGGIHAIVAPEQVIKHPEVDIVCIGEGEFALLELLNSIDKNKVDLSIKNLWIKDNGKIHKNTMRELLTFDNEFPFLDWSFYNNTNFCYPYEGRLYRRGSVSCRRGCPYGCAFCINDYYKNIYGKQSRAFHLKSIDYVIEEILYLKETYDLDMLRFWDETFLAMPDSYFVELSERYIKEVGLPFTIETTANTVNRKRLKLLAEMGCKSISVGIETTNEDLRKGLLNKKISNDTYEKCFKLIKEFGLRVAGNLMFFLPHQTLEDMWRDVYTCQEWQIDHPSARIFYPYLGTQLRNYCQKNGMLNLELLTKIEDENSISSLDCLFDNWVTFQDSVLNIQPEVKNEGSMVLDNFVLFMETPTWMHEMLKKFLQKQNSNANEFLKEIEHAVYIKRFGDEPKA